MRVIIIDDDRNHGESLSELLSARGYEAYFAPNWNEAKWLFDLFSFQLALLDQDMPELTGIEIARKLRERHPELRTVIMSARASNRELVEKELDDPLLFLPKPIRADELARVFRLVAGNALMRRVAYPIALYRGEGRT